VMLLHLLFVGPWNSSCVCCVFTCCASGIELVMCCYCGASGVEFVSCCTFGVSDVDLVSFYNFGCQASNLHRLKGCAQKCWVGATSLRHTIYLHAAVRRIVKVETHQQCAQIKQTRVKRQACCQQVGVNMSADSVLREMIKHRSP
jgi:hypothetical protein